jgi:hypothetical protein
MSIFSRFPSFLVFFPWQLEDLPGSIAMLQVRKQVDSSISFYNRFWLFMPSLLEAAEASTFGAYRVSS